MKRNLTIIGLLIVFIVVLSACAASSEPEKSQLNLEGPGEPDQMPADQPISDAPQSPSGVELPVWFSQELKDVNTGMVFKVAEFKGKVILVETLAVWCSKCLT